MFIVRDTRYCQWQTFVNIASVEFCCTSGLIGINVTTCGDDHSQQRVGHCYLHKHHTLPPRPSDRRCVHQAKEAEPGAKKPVPAAALSRRRASKSARADEA